MDGLVMRIAERTAALMEPGDGGWTVRELAVQTGSSLDMTRRALGWLVEQGRARTVNMCLHQVGYELLAVD